MDYMINFGILSHKYLIYSYIFVLFIQIYMLLKAEDINRYKKFVIVFNPMLTLPTIGGVVFSGLVLLTALKFQFNIAIVVMIISSVIMITNERIRVKKLERTLKDEFESYKKFALKLFVLNLFFVFVTTFLAVKLS